MSEVELISSRGGNKGLALVLTLVGKDSDPGCVSMNVCGGGWRRICLVWLSIAVSSSLGHAEVNLIRAQGALTTKIAPYIKVDSAFSGQTKYRTRCC